MNGAYLTFFPQFCQERINDRAWYPGFTDWDLIRSLTPDLSRRFTPYAGYYDLSLRGDIARQFRAIAHGPWSSIALYHYYFDGHFALEEVEKFILETDESVPNFFAIWANEAWTKRWLGRAHDIIMSQNHSIDDAIVETHVSRLSRLFRHPSYAKLDGRPVFVIYAAYEVPNVAKLVRAYRTEFRRKGFDPQIGFCASYLDPSFEAQEFDFCVEFQPRLFFNVVRGVNGPRATNIGLLLKKRLPWAYNRLTGIRDRLKRSNEVPRKYLNYSQYLALLEEDSFVHLLRETYELPVVRSLFYSWNNFPRYRGGAVAVKHQVGEYEKFLSLANHWRSTEPWFLVNSWNEWSEGAALEPGEISPERYEIE